MEELKIEDLIEEIARECYEFLDARIKENWRQNIPEPVDTFMTYCDEVIGDKICYVLSESYEEELIKKLNYVANLAADANVC